MKNLIVFSAAILTSAFAYAGHHSSGSEEPGMKDDSTMMEKAAMKKDAGSSDMEKIDSDFSSLDNNNDMYISMEEADDEEIMQHFKAIDTNDDKMLSQTEYNKYVMTNPSHVESELIEKMHEEEAE